MSERTRVLVTGGSRGLGLAIGEEFAKEGARVAFTYGKNDADAENARSRLESLGAEPLVFKGQVFDAAHAREAIGGVTAAWGGLDVLVNNAGINQILPVALVDEADWDLVVDVNLKGPYLFSRAALRPMIRAKKGVILNIGTFASERMVEAPVHYAAAKSGLRGLTESLAREVGRYNVRVVLLSPGLLEVGLAKMLPPHRLAEYLSQCPAGRLGSAEEVARFAVFLASDDASLITGAKVVLDGGL